jgi:hypothetical protein
VEVTQKSEAVIVLKGTSSVLKQSVQLNNLFFEMVKFDILPTSYPELDRRTQIIQNNQLKLKCSGIPATSACRRAT